MWEQITITLESLRAFWTELGRVLPRLAVSLLALTLGWIIAKGVRKGVIKLLKLLRVDVAAERTGVDDFLLQGGVKYTIVTIVGSLVYWFIMFAVMLAVLNSMGLQAADELFNRIISYIPNVVLAVLVLMFGTLFARFVRGMTFTYLNNIGIAGADFVSHVAQWALIVFVISAALEQLALGGQLLASAFEIAFGALCLALALAFGLGGKEWAAHILKKFWKE